MKKTRNTSGVIIIEYKFLFSFMTALTLLWRTIRNSEGRITRIYDLENDQFDTKSASIIICK